MILVTGGGGMLGAELCRLALARGTPVAAAVGARPAPNGIGAVSGDLADAAHVRRIVDRFRPSWVVHTAAWTDVNACETDPARADRANADAAGVVAAEAARAGAGLIAISTDSVFDGERGLYTEADPVAPLHAYGRSKLRGEAAVLAAHPGAVVLRTAIVGKSTGGQPGLLDWLLAAFREGRAVDGYRDLWFSPITTTDFAECILRLIERPVAGGIHHAGGHGRIDKAGFAQLVAEWVGADPGLVRPCDAPASRVARPRDVSLSSSRLESLLGGALPTPRESLLRHLAQRADLRAAMP